MNKIVIEGHAKTRDVFINGKKLDPKKSQKVVNHSPDGFNWGYGGSGPAQLALAILLEFFSRQDAVRNYQEFKRQVISGLPFGKNFSVEFYSDPEITKFINDKKLQLTWQENEQ